MTIRVGKKCNHSTMFLMETNKTIKINIKYCICI